MRQVLVVLYITVRRKMQNDNESEWDSIRRRLEGDATGNARAGVAGRVQPQPQPPPPTSYRVSADTMAKINHDTTIPTTITTTKSYKRQQPTQHQQRQTPEHHSVTSNSAGSSSRPGAYAIEGMGDSNDGLEMVGLNTSTGRQGRVSSASRSSSSKEDSDEAAQRNKHNKMQQKCEEACSECVCQGEEGSSNNSCRRIAQYICCLCIIAIAVGIILAVIDSDDGSKDEAQSLKLKSELRQNITEFITNGIIYRLG